MFALLGAITGAIAMHTIDQIATAHPSQGIQIRVMGGTGIAGGSAAIALILTAYNRKNHTIAALRKREERLRLALQGSNDGFWDWNVRANEVFYSTRWKAMRGFQENEIGTHPDECLSRVHPDDFAAFMQAIQQHIDRKTPTFVAEYRTCCKDGSYIWILDRAQAFWDKTGTCVRFAGSETDITARKIAETAQQQTEATLREANRRWRTLLESIRLVVVGLDRNNQVEYVNSFFLELTGYAKSEVIGKDWFAHFMPNYQKQTVQSCFAELVQQGSCPHCQSSILTKLGEEKAIAWNHTLLRDPQGAVIGTMSIGEDVTQARAIEQMKDEFISVVSHELRTPLASIHGGLHLLASGLVEPHSDRGKRVIEIASESADRLVLLVNDILELERLELGQIRLSKQPCEAAELLQQAVNTLHVIARRARVTLLSSADPIQVLADPDRINQVLMNLLGNAIKIFPQKFCDRFNSNPASEAGCIYRQRSRARYSRETIRSDLRAVSTGGYVRFS